ncbi:MAG: tetratricopeptide repeat protein [Deltaproteobacteria bacterium]|nr:tetratricopeptide repeat protein [Deltaproteobacteria bacterium]
MAGCGGSAESARPARAAARAAAPAPAPATVAAARAEEPEQPASKGAERFAQIAKQLEEQDAAKPLDTAALERELKEVLDLDPKHSAARFNLAVLAEKRGDRDAARRAYEAIAQDDPDFAPAAENLAGGYVEAGDTHRAIAIYDRIIKADAKNLTSRLALARILQAEGKHQQAIALCRQVLQRKADAIEAFRVLAESYFALGDQAMAQLIIGRGLKIDENDVHLLYLLAQILLSRNDLAPGVDRLKQVIRKSPSWLKPRAQLAEIALKYEDFGNAAQQFEAILKEKADDRAARIGLAVSYKGLGRYDQAEKIYRELLKSNDKDLDAVWNLAVLYYRHLNRYDEAVTLYQRAKSLASSGDEQAAKVDQIVAEIERIKKDEAARKAREERERKKREALAAACQAVTAGRKPNADDIGNDEERIKEAWDRLLVKAANDLQAGSVEPAKSWAECALAIVPTSPGAGAVACAQLRLQWVQIQDQAGLLTSAAAYEKALGTVKQAMACDPENPDAPIFEQQIEELLGQARVAEGGAPPPAPEPQPKPPPTKRRRR